MAAGSRKPIEHQHLRYVILPNPQQHSAFHWTCQDLILQNKTEISFVSNAPGSMALTGKYLTGSIIKVPIQTWSLFQRLCLWSIKKIKVLVYVRGLTTPTRSSNWRAQQILQIVFSRCVMLRKLSIKLFKASSRSGGLPGDSASGMDHDGRCGWWRALGAEGRVN